MRMTVWGTVINMGYTHYWTFKPIKRGDARKINKAFKQATKECAVLVRAFQKEYGGLSGYTAHTEPGEYGGVYFNGSKDDAHETFVIREHYKDNLGLQFCKTARKPYDTCVTACLIILKHRLGEYIDVSSDGQVIDWAMGLAAAREIRGLTRARIPNTINSSPKGLYLVRLA
jgi:hypothetical protein